jgi:predicted nucleic acid-binding protein
MSLLDTGVIIEMLRGKKQRQGLISIITFAEVLRGVGVQKRPVLKRLLEESFVVLDLDSAVVEKYCELYSSLKKQGSLLPDADLFIAATAMAHDLSLETTDDHFRRLKPSGLKLK